MPAPIPSFIERGIELMTHSRRPVRLRMRTSTPPRNTAPSATSHGCFMPSTTEKVK